MANQPKHPGIWTSKRFKANRRPCTVDRTADPIAPSLLA